MINTQDKPLYELEDGVDESAVKLLPKLKDVLLGLMASRGADQRRLPMVILKANGCWDWNSSIRGDGYRTVQSAEIRRTGRQYLMAHRFTYEKIVGPIPDGLTIDHLCRNRACCNPEHLEPCTLVENISRGLGWPEINRWKTHCRRGHDLAVHAKVYHRKSGKTSRECQLCSHIRLKAWLEKHPGYGKKTVPA